MRVQISEAEKRFTRAKTLFLANQLNDKEFEREKKRLDDYKRIMQSDKYQSVISLAKTLLPNLANWASLAPWNAKGSSG